MKDSLREMISLSIVPAAMLRQIGFSEEQAVVVDAIQRMQLRFSLRLVRGLYEVGGRSLAEVRREYRTVIRALVKGLLDPGGLDPERFQLAVREIEAGDAVDATLDEAAAPAWAEAVRVIEELIVEIATLPDPE